MSRRIRAIRKELPPLSYKLIKKIFKKDEELNSFKKTMRNYMMNSVRTTRGCTNAGAPEQYGCIAQVTYGNYNWGVTKEGKVNFCCLRTPYDPEDYEGGKSIESEVRPALVKLLKKRKI